ncbi:MAG TPA: membrane protein insertase YidC [Methylophaga aminisulfidivorans]|uniref:Membrane protein insertase YidC n=1 Tax=Methylophaga aminisulfidivorans MP TaxID=1026882 RepID=F5SY93_9GAMM|nr:MULTISPECIES: membrane protein insertase YidC [Methylophaga]EGL54138.1 preprotein translocase subunit YidC [Methylophaga aminisulfidivorans MP]HIC46597.1 membrane protein insertase YidC [Methylophaga sp.]HIM39924.1 membrane protein insertase YidC [Methylophaga aminisulfidivorans]
MDNLRTLFIFGLLIVSLLLWQAWQKDYVHPQQTEQNTTSTQIDDGSLAANDAALPDMPSVSAEALPDVPESAQSSAATKQKIHVTTDVMDIEISTQGGDIQNLALLKYAVSSEEPNTPVQFLSDKSDAYFVSQSGLRSNMDVPTHYAIYKADQQNYQLRDGQDEIKVPLYWQADNGLTVVKTYTFKRDSYVVNVDYKIINNTADAFSAYPYAQFNRQKQSSGSRFIYTYSGPVFSNTGNEYEKVKFDDLDEKPFDQKAKDGWAAMIEHYFVAAIVPEQNDEEKGYYARSLNGTNYTAGVRMPAISVAAGSEGHADYEMYLGPKKAERLEKVAKNLQLTVDYGIFTIISEPLFWVMEWLHKLTGNWGWSIVLLTVLIKLVFFKLSAASYRSMAAMRKLTPKLASLKERYGDDKQKFNQAMMDLYRTEKINPLGGCLPILVQMPVFLSFYWVLVESIELRQADFILWINDLTAMDPYFILPVLFGISMWFQQTLNPAPQDPAQAMMMKFFPLVFTVFFAFFPSGLVLYWVVNNVLSIAQQWYITRKMDAL